MSNELILNEIEKNREEHIEFLRDLIKTESYNPPGNEKNVAIKIEKYLNENGIKCDLFSFGNNRANLIAYLNNNFNGKNLIYNGHMDVVPPGNESEWKNPPLSAFIKKKKIIIGRGAADMKGGLAAMAISLKILKKLNVPLSGNLILNAVSDEETGGTYGTKWCLENKLKNINCDFIVIGEPSGLSPLPKAILLGEKGHLQVKIITNGISCHASTPFLGKNAIYMMSDIIQNLDKLENIISKVEPPFSIEELKTFLSKVFPNREIFEKIYEEQQVLQNVIKANTTFTKSLNTIIGGIKENVVPDKCEAVIDFRLLPGQSIDSVLNALKIFINDLGYEVKNEPIAKPEKVFVYLEVFHQSEPSVWKEWENSENLKLFFSVIENIYEKKPFYFLMPACSDAHFYRNSGFCPATVAFGPGSAATAHATNEFIEIDDYINAIKTYTLFAYMLLK